MKCFVNAEAQETGLVQSAFMFGIGLGGLTCATIVRTNHERLILWLCPLIVCPVLLAIPWAVGIPLMAAVCLAGILPTRPSPAIEALVPPRRGPWVPEPCTSAEWPRWPR